MKQKGVEVGLQFQMCIKHKNKLNTKLKTNYKDKKKQEENCTIN